MPLRANGVTFTLTGVVLELYHELDHVVKTTTKMGNDVEYHKNDSLVYR